MLATCAPESKSSYFFTIALSYVQYCCSIRIIIYKYSSFRIALRKIWQTASTFTYKKSPIIIINGMKNKLTPFCISLFSAIK
ncbi:hypothetical protein BD65_342 [Yersinia ruckeri]|nr:hypothetical protein BD65_342 [Yersinia ruckeri]